MTPRRWAWLIVLLHILLATAFNLVTPYKTAGWQDGHYQRDIGAPDEEAHANYVNDLWQTGQFPVMVPGQAGNETRFQSHQAPLYYLATAAWVAPWRGVDSAPHWARFLNTLFGALFVAGTMVLGWRITGRRDVALAAGAVVAVLPMNVALSGAVSNDPLLFALCTWALALGLAPSRPRELWIAGACAGLALLTKTSALALVPGLLLWAVIAPREERKQIALALVVVPVAIGSVWWMRNLSIYGDPLAQNVFLAQFRPDAPPIDSLLALKSWAYNLVHVTSLSLVGRFGYMSIPIPRLLMVTCWAALAIAALFALRHRGEVDRRWWVLGLFAICVLGLYLKFNITYVQPQARYVFLALGVAAVWLMRGVRERTFLWGLPALLLLTTVVSLQTLPGEFRQRIEDLRAAQIAGRAPMQR